MTETTLRYHTYQAPHDPHTQRDPDTIARENAGVTEGQKSRWIDPQGVHEVLGPGQTLREAFETVFGSAIDNYNAKQTRADRKMTVGGYIQSVEDSRRGRPVKAIQRANEKAIAQGREQDVRKEAGQRTHYEVVVSLGNVKPLRDPKTGKVVRDKTGLRVRPDYVEADVTRKILDEYIEGWSARNPNFYLFRGDFHNDEWYKVTTGGYAIKGLPGQWLLGEPHGHLDFIAFADGYQRGPKRQVSVTKALAAMGYVDRQDADGRKVTAWEQWQDAERDAIKEIARRHGYEIVPADDSREALAANEYAELQDARDELYETQARTAGLEAREAAVIDKEEELEARERGLDAREADIVVREAEQEAQRERLKTAADLLARQKREAADLDERLPRLRKQASKEEARAAKAAQTAEEASQRAAQWGEHFRVLEREEQALQARIAALRDRESEAYQEAWDAGARSDYAKLNARLRSEAKDTELTAEQKRENARRAGIGLIE